ncbi:MAG TPA: hypothetical protein VGI86_13470 [Acidimicrobiia bacterium]
MLGPKATDARYDDGGEWIVRRRWVVVLAGVDEVEPAGAAWCVADEHAPASSSTATTTALRATRPTW